MKHKFKVLLLVCLIGVFGQIRAQVWPLHKGEVYANASLSTLAYHKAFDASGDVVDIPVDITDRTWQLFAQYGITDKLTAQIKVPYKMISSEGELGAYNSYPDQYLETGTMNGFGNAEFGALYNFMQDKPLLSASFFVETPGEKYNYLTGLQTGFNSWAFRPGVGAGWTYGPTWLQFYLGTSLRTNNYDHAAISNLEFGFKPADYLYTAMVFDMRQSFNNGEDCDCTNTATAMYVSDQEYLGLALKAGFTAGRIGVNFAYHTAMAAKFAPAAGVPVVGVQFRSN